MEKEERLVQLVTLLLATRVPLPFTAIQRQMHDYYGDPDDTEHRDASKRMFERDKDDLRAMGVPIELVSIDQLVEGDQGYRIMPERYYLPDISFTPEEAAALTILATDPGEDDAAIQGLRKLIYGVEGGPLSSSGSVVAPGPDQVGTRLEGVFSALRTHRAVRFGYRNAAGDGSTRMVDPYGLVTRDGHWYLVGRDRAQDAIRAFRSSRIEGTVEVTDEEAAPAPEDFEAAAHVVGPWEADTGAMALIAVDPSVSWWARRSIRDARDDGVRPDGWHRLRVPVTGDLVSSVLRFGADAELLEPEDLRAELVASLEERAHVAS